MSLTNATNSATIFKVKNAASTLNAHERKDLPIHALSGKSTVTRLAKEANTSRKFIYSQKHKAMEALDMAFADPPPTSNNDQTCSLFFRALFERVQLILTPYKLFHFLIS